VAFQALDGQTLITVWNDSGKRAADSRVTLRQIESGPSSGRCLVIDVVLRSMPTRSSGPDDDKAGADPQEVQLRTVRLVAEQRTILEFERFSQWYETNEPPQIEADSTQGCRTLYSEATREYQPGKDGPAFYQSRCRLRIPMGVFKDVRRINNPALIPTTLELTTRAGVLSVPLGQIARQPAAVIEQVSAPTVQNTAAVLPAGMHRWD
jgi:hypothetical protein